MISQKTKNLKYQEDQQISINTKEPFNMKSLFSRLPILHFLHILYILCGCKYQTKNNKTIAVTIPTQKIGIFIKDMNSNY